MKEMLEYWLVDGYIPTFNQYDTARRKDRTLKEKGVENAEWEELNWTYRAWGDESLHNEWAVLVALCIDQEVGKLGDPVTNTIAAVRPDLKLALQPAINGDWINDVSRPAEFNTEDVVPARLLM